MNGLPQSSLTGATLEDGTHDGAISNITHALNLLYNPRASNDQRHEADKYLNAQKFEPEAPFIGFQLASNTQHAPTVRHYGLSLLEHCIRHTWSDYSEEQGAMVRGWVVDLACAVQDQHAIYVRNKVGQLVVEIAKRSWALDWMDLDQTLVQLWGQSLIHKELVLLILETLSEDVFSREDTLSGLRGNDLNRACVEIFTPANVLAEHFPSREELVDVRCNSEGWLARISALLDTLSQSDLQKQEAKSCTIRALGAMRSTMSWVIPKAISSSRCVESICSALMSPDVDVQTVSFFL